MQTEEKKKLTPEERARRNEIERLSNIKNSQRVGLKLNKNTDADIIEHLNKQDNKQGYIKKIIREDIARTTEDTEQ